MTYAAHASCWLAELGDGVGEPTYLQAAGKHLDWVLGHRDPDTGWFDLAGFWGEDDAARRDLPRRLSGRASAPSRARTRRAGRGSG